MNLKDEQMKQMKQMFSQMTGGGKEKKSSHDSSKYDALIKQYSGNPEHLAIAFEAERLSHIKNKPPFTDIRSVHFNDHLFRNKKFYKDQHKLLTAAIDRNDQNNFLDVLYHGIDPRDSSVYDYVLANATDSAFRAFAIRKLLEFNIAHQYSKNNLVFSVVQKNDPALFIALAQSGIDLNVRDNRGDNIFSVAIANKSFDLIPFMGLAGIKSEIDHKGNYPVHIITEQMVNDINEKNSFSLAKQKEYFSFLSRFKMAGHNIAEKNVNGYSILDQINQIKDNNLRAVMTAIIDDIAVRDYSKLYPNERVTPLPTVLKKTPFYTNPQNNFYIDKDIHRGIQLKRVVANVLFLGLPAMANALGNKLEDSIAKSIDEVKVRVIDLIANNNESMAVNDIKKLINLNQNNKFAFIHRPVNEKNDSLLHFLIERDAVLAAREFLKAKPNLNEYNTDGDTPLSLAVKRRNWELVQMLIDGGADINYVTPDGKGLVQLARENSHNMAFAEKLISVYKVPDFHVPTYNDYSSDSLAPKQEDNLKLNDTKLIDGPPKDRPLDMSLIPSWKEEMYERLKMAVKTNNQTSFNEILNKIKPEDMGDFMVTSANDGNLSLFNALVQYSKEKTLTERAQFGDNVLKPWGSLFYTYSDDFKDKNKKSAPVVEAMGLFVTSGIDSPEMPNVINDVRSHIRLVRDWYEPKVDPTMDGAKGFDL